MSQPNVLELALTNEERIEALETFQRNLIDIVYPIGSIYMSMNDVSPATFLGGTWERIQDRFLLSANENTYSGVTGGEATHTLTQAETPAHTHTRGTMEIIGSIKVVGSGSNARWNVNIQSTGAFYEQHIANIQQYAQTVENTNDNTASAGFQASRSWTGATSSVGGNQPHNNMPPYLTVYMWKRTL